MFGPRKNENQQIDDAIARVHAQMLVEDLDSQKYQDLLRSLERLNALKTPPRPMKVSPDAKWGSITTLLVALVLVGYEQGNVLTSKAIMLIKPPKINQ